LQKKATNTLIELMFSIFTRQNHKSIGSFYSAMMLAGALTARLSGVPWKPARQSAATRT